MATPVELLTDIKASLGELPQRLTALLSERPTPGGRESRSKSEPGLGKLPATENLLGAAGKFLPGLSELGDALGNLRQLGDAVSQFQGAFRSKAKAMPDMPQTELKPQAELKPDKLPSLSFAGGKIGGDMEAKILKMMEEQGQNLNTGGLPDPLAGGQSVASGQMTGKVDSVLNKMDDLIEALNNNTPEDAERGETQKPEKPIDPAEKPPRNIAPGKTQPMENPFHSRHNQQQRGTAPFNPGQQVQSTKEGMGGTDIWDLGKAALKLLGV